MNQAVAPDEAPEKSASREPRPMADEKTELRLVNPDNAAPLSAAQQQIWLHAQLVPEIPLYNEPVTFHHRGMLDLTALCEALTEVVSRHQSWRTTFPLVNGEAAQVIQPAMPVRIEIADLRKLPDHQRNIEAGKLAVRDSLRPFSLSHGPLFRALLVHLSDTEQKLFLTLHHIIFDGYSIYRVLLPELSALYQAFAEGKPSPLPPFAFHYADYARQEQEWLGSSSRLQSQLSYWRKQLAGSLPLLPLPSDRSRPAAQTFRGAIVPLQLLEKSSEALRQLSRREGATLFMTMVAAFAVLLHRYCNVDDVVIGTVSSGRKKSELEGLLGYFLNPIALRNDLTGNPSFRELLRRTRNMSLDALSNDDAPFMEVVSAVHPTRSLSFHPIFQVLLTLEPPLPTTISDWSVTLTQPEADTGFSKFDLCMELDDRPSGIVGRLKYNTDLFDESTIRRMARNFRTLVEGILANPDEKISRLPLLEESERDRILMQWNETSGAYPDSLTVGEMFCQAVRRTPHAAALVAAGNDVARGREITYAELDRQSDRIAAKLHELGVAAQTCVGLYFETSIDMVAGILGVLKAGGICLPLDSSYPKQRLDFVLRDAAPAVVLTNRELQAKIPLSAVRTFCIDELEIESSDFAFAAPVHDPESIAYLIYTSGSSGQPKGVQITHANLSHSTQARAAYYGSNLQRFLLLSSFSFDSSLAGLFGALCQGHTLVLTPGSMQETLPDLAVIVKQERITHLLCVPSLYSLLLDQARPGDLTSLRGAIVAGESCPPELVDRHYRLHPGCALYNEYGPTEGTVWSTVYRCQPGMTSPSVSIGKPIANVRTYVLDSEQEPTPIGVPGELYIAGKGIARGYLNRAGETAARFLPDPFSSELRARLYKTGDRARYLPDGNIELLGRFDDQVKIRGVRIELQEIESVIAEFRGVRQAAVIVSDTELREPKLVAYVEMAQPDSFDSDALRAFLHLRLPQAMLPSAVLVVDSLPRTPNGKLDRRTLPTTYVPAAREPVQPRTAVELELSQIWQHVLDRTDVGVTDNFFDWGGHSLLAAKLLLRVEQEFGKRLSLADIFQAPTIRQMAAMLTIQQRSQQHPAVIPVQPHGAKAPLFWIRGGAFLLPMGRILGYDQPVLGLHLPASDAAKLPVPYKFEDIAEALIVRLREVQPEGPYFLAGLCVNGVMAYEMARQLTERGQEVALLALFDAQNPAYYEDFSQGGGRLQWLLHKIGYHGAELRRQGVYGYVGERAIGLRRRLSVRYWRLHNSLALPVRERQLRDLDTIMHPASFNYRPKPYTGRAVFFQSSDWPTGPYWDFYASWDNVIRSGMEVIKIRGGHESMFLEENVEVLGRRLKWHMQKAPSTTPRRSIA